MEPNEKETFNYTYSATQQDEVKAIREKYAPSEESKMEQLRRLDAGVTRKASARAITVGTVGALLFGLGMSLVMSDFGKNLGLDGNLAMKIGIMVGLLGIAVACCVYPLYNRTVKKEREKITPEILRLTDELMK